MSETRGEYLDDIDKVMANLVVKRIQLELDNARLEIIRLTLERDELRKLCNELTDALRMLGKDK
jgi:hypothetical protein